MAYVADLSVFGAWGLPRFRIRGNRLSLRFLIACVIWLVSRFWSELRPELFELLSCPCDRDVEAEACNVGCVGGGGQRERGSLGACGVNGLALEIPR